MLNPSVRCTPNVTITKVVLAEPPLFNWTTGVGLGLPVLPVKLEGIYKYPCPALALVNAAVKLALYVPDPVLGCGVSNVKLPNTTSPGML